MGGNVALGFANGMTTAQAQQAVSNGATTLADAAKAAFIRAFQTSSPSKWMRDNVGLQIAAGIALGITGGGSQATDSIDQLSALIKGKATQLTQLPGFTSLVGNNVGVDAGAGVAATPDWVRELMNKLDEGSTTTRDLREWLATNATGDTLNFHEVKTTPADIVRDVTWVRRPNRRR
jgi:hypothetical protein